MQCASWYSEYTTCIEMRETTNEFHATNCTTLRKWSTVKSISPITATIIMFLHCPLPTKTSLCWSNAAMYKSVHTLFACLATAYPLVMCHNPSSLCLSMPHTSSALLPVHVRELIRTTIGALPSQLSIWQTTDHSYLQVLMRGCVIYQIPTQHHDREPSRPNHQHLLQSSSMHPTALCRQDLVPPRAVCTVCNRLQAFGTRLPPTCYAIAPYDRLARVCVSQYSNHSDYQRRC
jgi:hypothetical protein